MLLGQHERDNPEAKVTLAEILLIIDDDRELQRAYRRVLEANGYVVVQAYDALGGLAAAREQRVALIVLDVGLPDMDGREVLALLKADQLTARVPVVICSGGAPGLDRATVLGQGAGYFMDKPCAQDLLELLLGR